MIKRDVVGAGTGPKLCPVARALKRHFGAEQSSCGFTTCNIEIRSGPRTVERRYFDLDNKTAVKIHKFEDMPGTEVGPWRLPHTIKLTETT